MIDRFSIPLAFFMPYVPMNMEVTLKDGESKIQLNVVLQTKGGLPDDQIDSLTQLSVKWLDFDPLPNCTVSYNLWLAPAGFPVGS